jgi:hypothetical protein
MAAVASTATKTGAPGPPAGPAPLAREASLAYDPCWAGPGEEIAGDGVTAGNRRPTLPTGPCGGTAPMTSGGPGRIGAVAPPWSGRP